MSFKIAFIGAGSLVFARTLFTDIMSVPEFQDIEIAFTDINEDNLFKFIGFCLWSIHTRNIINISIATLLASQIIIKSAKQFNNHEKNNNIKK